MDTAKKAENSTGCAGAALLQFSGNITNFAAISQQNSFKGWTAASVPCSGWTGITCDSYGQVNSLYVTLPSHVLLCRVTSLLLTC